MISLFNGISNFEVYINKYIYIYICVCVYVCVFIGIDR